MKFHPLTLIFLVSICIPLSAQIDKETLSLKVSKVEEANLQKLKEYIWKRRSDVFVESQLKLTTITEFSYNSEGKLQAQIVDKETTMKKKPGLRGVAQANAAEDKADYIQNALKLGLEYTFMTMGETLDFFSKANVVEKNGFIEAVANDVHVPGDRLLVRIDPKTFLYTYKEFTSLLNKDKIEGKLNYQTFENGINHLSTTAINLPVQKMTIDARNQDYSVRVK